MNILTKFVRCALLISLFSVGTLGCGGSSSGPAEAPPANAVGDFLADNPDIAALEAADDSSDEDE